MPGPRAQDELLEPPLVRSPSTVRAVEDRSYVVFIAGAMAMALGAGFVLAVLVALGEAGSLGLETRVPRLIQAHGWAQVQGWGGLFVAGMGLRLLPRFAGRPPLPRRLSLPVFGLLFLGIVARVVAQSFDMGRGSELLFLGGALLAAGGTAAFAVLVLRELFLGRKAHEPWRWFCLAGGAWWAIWAVIAVEHGVRAAGNDAYISPSKDDPATWAILLAAIGNFIWGVQSRSVPIFFGRKTPSVRKVVVPGALLNAGAIAFLASGYLDPGDSRDRLIGVGAVGAGVALLWLPPICGAVHGTASRLRPRARPAARFVLAGNLFAMLAGLLLGVAGVQWLFFDGDHAFALADGARHAYGAGLLTLLIVGMAQLVAPFFAMRRVEPGSAPVAERAIWWLLVAGAGIRVTTGLLAEEWDIEPRMHTAALAGSLAWLGLALFAWAVARAIQNEPRMKALVADQVRHDHP